MSKNPMLVTFPAGRVATFLEGQIEVMQVLSQGFGPTTVSSLRKCYLEEHRLYWTLRWRLYNMCKGKSQIKTT